MLLSPLAPVLTPQHTNGWRAFSGARSLFQKGVYLWFYSLFGGAAARFSIFIFSSALGPSNVSPCKAPSSTQNPFCNPLHVHLFQAENFPKITKKIQINRTTHFRGIQAFNCDFLFHSWTKEPRTRLERFIFLIILVCSCFVFRKICYRHEYYKYI